MAQAVKEDVQVAPVFADRGEPTSAKSSCCQYTAKQNQCAVLYTGAQKYYSALVHMLGALLVVTLLNSCIIIQLELCTVMLQLYSS